MPQRGLASQCLAVCRSSLLLLVLEAAAGHGSVTPAPRRPLWAEWLHPETRAAASVLGQSLEADRQPPLSKRRGGCCANLLLLLPLPPCLHLPAAGSDWGELVAARCRFNFPAALSFTSRLLWSPRQSRAMSLETWDGRPASCESRGASRRVPPLRSSRRGPQRAQPGLRAPGTPAATGKRSKLPAPAFCRGGVRPLSSLFRHPLPPAHMGWVAGSLATASALEA